MYKFIIASLATRIPDCPWSAHETWEEAVAEREDYSNTLLLGTDENFGIDDFWKTSWFLWIFTVEQYSQFNRPLLPSSKRWIFLDTGTGKSQSVKHLLKIAGCEVIIVEESDMDIEGIQNLRKILEEDIRNSFGIPKHILTDRLNKN